MDPATPSISRAALVLGLALVAGCVPSQVTGKADVPVIIDAVDGGFDPGPVACVPDCEGRECGPDGCGGSCGSCVVTQLCLLGRCTHTEVCGRCPEEPEGMVCGGDPDRPDWCWKEGCGEVDEVGLCVEDRAIFCIDDQLYSMDCAFSLLTCRFDPDAGWHDCE